jgi:uncharacterized membrane protein YfcA
MNENPYASPAAEPPPPEPDLKHAALFLFCGFVCIGIGAIGVLFARKDWINAFGAAFVLVGLGLIFRVLAETVADRRSWEHWLWRTLDTVFIILGIFGFFGAFLFSLFQ